MFDSQQMLSEIERAYRMGDIVPGLSSLIVFDPSFDPGEAAVADFLDASRLVSEREGSANGTFLSVFVAPDTRTRAFAEVYCGSWHGLGVATPRHMIVDTLAEAEALLGTTMLGDMVAALMPQEGIRYLSKNRTR